VLARLTVRSLAENQSTRRTLVREFCRATLWRNRKGEWCLSSANVALKRLERHGLVRLNPPARREPRTRPRQLVDDGLELPPTPRLPQSVDRLHNLRLEWVTGQNDPHHRLWNRLIIREHPLKAAPLVGSQLRYLIRSDEAILGAIGFGPAAFHLACRDAWIGWDAQAMELNRGRVIGLARMLIRPGIRCANLASRTYRLALSRVAADWRERHGVSPLLVETYVDRSTQTGTSLSAANWRRLGQSSGRGRSSPTPHVRPKGTKDLWVYELAPRAREELQHCPECRVTPRSIFHGFGPVSWVEEELDGLALGSVRLEQRFSAMLQSRWAQPMRSFGTSFGADAAAKAAYRLITNRQADVGFESLLAPHRHQTHRRMAAESMVVLAQDTTTLSYNSLHQTEGLGPVGDTRNPGRGLLLHCLHAFRPDRIPLGCAWAKVWARSSESDTDTRNEQSVDEKESARWVQAYQEATRLARSMPQTILCVCGDRESDIFELFDQAEVAPKNLHMLVRAQHDRLLESGGKLWEELARQPLGGTLKVNIPRNTDRPARTATLELRWASVEIAPPRVALKKSWRPIRLCAVMARELNPPAGAEPIEWVLLTSWKIDSSKMACRMVRWYGLRWGIECWHQVLKGMCRVETRQMKSATALERALVLDMIVAWRALLLCRLGKEHPNLPASLHYSPEELAVLEVHREKLPARLSAAASPTPEARSSEERPQPPGETAPKQPGSGPGGPAGICAPLSLYQANILVAMLAGFWARKGDGHPGPRMMGQGLMLLAALVEHQRLIASQAREAPPRREPSRKPG
jgi:hypothetical protein